MKDITKYVSKDKNTEELQDFFADFEDYDSGLPEIPDMEVGDMVGWNWNGKHYIGILRDGGNVKDGMFDIKQVRLNPSKL